MKVIIKKTGKVQEVPDGYARNHLLPNGLAVIATKEGIQQAETLQKKALHMQQKEQEQWKTVVKTLPSLTVHVTAAANTDGTLFGSLPESAILTGLNTQHHLSFQADWLQIDAPIKHVGIVDIAVEFPNGTRTTFHLNITKK